MASCSKPRTQRRPKRKVERTSIAGTYHAYPHSLAIWHSHIMFGILKSVWQSCYPRKTTSIDDMDTLPMEEMPGLSHTMVPDIGMSSKLRSTACMLYVWCSLVWTYERTGTIFFSGLVIWGGINLRTLCVISCKMFFPPQCFDTEALLGIQHQSTPCAFPTRFGCPHL